MLTNLPDDLKSSILKAINHTIDSENKELTDTITNLEADLEDERATNQVLERELDVVDKNNKYHDQDLVGLIKWALSEGADPINAISFVSPEVMHIVLNQNLTFSPKEKLERKIDYRPFNYKPPLGMEDVAARGKILELD